MFLRLISEYVLNPDGGPRPGELIRASPVATAGSGGRGGWRNIRSCVGG